MCLASGSGFSPHHPPSEGRRHCPTDCRQRAGSEGGLQVVTLGGGCPRGAARFLLLELVVIVPCVWQRPPSHPPPHNGRQRRPIAVLVEGRRRGRPHDFFPRCGMPARSCWVSAAGTPWVCPLCRQRPLSPPTLPRRSARPPNCLDGFWPGERDGKEESPLVGLWVGAACQELLGVGCWVHVARFTLLGSRCWVRLAWPFGRCGAVLVFSCRG